MHAAFSGAFVALLLLSSPAAARERRRRALACSGAAGSSLSASPAISSLPGVTSSALQAAPTSFSTSTTANSAATTATPAPGNVVTDEVTQTIVITKTMEVIWDGSAISTVEALGIFFSGHGTGSGLTGTNSGAYYPTAGLSDSRNHTRPRPSTGPLRQTNTTSTSYRSTFTTLLSTVPFSTSPSAAPSAIVETFKSTAIPATPSSTINAIPTTISSSTTTSPVKTRKSTVVSVTPSAPSSDSDSKPNPTDLFTLIITPFLPRPTA